MMKFLKSRRVVLWSSALILVAIFGYISLSMAQKEPQQKNYTAPEAKAAKRESSALVIKTSKEAITLGEFESAYRRMNDKDPYSTTLDSLKDFLTIYSDYRLKLLEAKELKIDQDPKIQKEIESYRTMLAGPFVLDKEITEPAIHKIWERRQWEVDAAHFLAGTAGKNSPADTLRAYKRALKAIEKLNNGETMTEVVLSAKDLDFNNNGQIAVERERENRNKRIVDSNAWEGSDDKGSMKNGGELGFFTGGQTVREFEDAVYSLKVGEYTKTPIRTKFGYHVILLLDKHPRLGGLKVHHILINMNGKTVKGPDTMQYYHKADSLLKVIKAGANFETIARESSEDFTTRNKGGDLEYIDRELRRTELSFDKAAYALKDGEISGIVRTSRGYHIIRRDGSFAPKSFDQEKEGLKKQYKSYYFAPDREEKLLEIRKQHAATINQPALNIFMSRVDSGRTTLDSNWAKKFTPGERNIAIAEMEGKKFSIGSLIDSMSAQPGTPLARNSVTDQINKKLDDEAVGIMASDLSKRFPEFEDIMTDYKNGIMLFELENKRIWLKVIPDSLKERKFYDDHKARFMWPERVDVSEIYVYNDSIAASVYKRIINGENFDTLAKKYTERPGFKEKAGHWGLMARDENEMSKKAFVFAVDDVKEPFSFQSGFSIVKVSRRAPITQKSYEEARQEVASQYQDELSSELRLDWVNELRKKYKRQINTKPIEDAWKENHLSAKDTDTAPGNSKKM